LPALPPLSLHDALPIYLDGRVVAEADGGEIAAPLEAFAHDVFILDLTSNRYVMSRTENLAPLLDLPRTTLELADGIIRNTGNVGDRKSTRLNSSHDQIS